MQSSSSTSKKSNTSFSHHAHQAASKAPEQLEAEIDHHPEPFAHKGSVSLRFENMSERATKIYFASYSFILITCIGVGAWMIAWVSDVSALEVRENGKIDAGNTVVSAIVLIILLLYSIYYVVQLVKVIWSKKYFGPRRRKLCILASVDMLLAIVMMVFFLVPSAFLWQQQCGWFLRLPIISSYIRIAATSAIVSNQILHALTFMPLSLWNRTYRWAKHLFSRQNLTKYYVGDSVGRQEQELLDSTKEKLLGIDLSWKYYTAIFFVSFLPCVFLEFFTRPLYGFCTDLFDLSCYPFADPNIPCIEWQWGCTTDSTAHILGIVRSVWVLVVLLVYITMIFLSKRELRQLPYRYYRIAHIQLVLQTYIRILALIMCLFLVTIRWFMHFVEPCEWEILFYSKGNVAAGIVLSSLSLFSCHVYCPIDLDQREIKLHAWLQDFAWTEKEVPEKLAARPFTGEPCFCFETALKCYYFSMLMYYFEEEESNSYTLDTAMGLYSLEDHKLLWHRKHDVKCLVCWSTSNATLTLSFRGTASMANVRADLKVWRASYPPVTGSYLLGTQPMVHAGFLESWQHSGLQKEIHTLVQQILSNNPTDHDHPWRVILTGHSLGGALAELASYDIATMYSSTKKVHITCMTYGCPRPGNYAFANKFRQVVPDAWDVVQTSDIIARSGKFLFLYKHAANMVIVSTKGDLIVRPSYIEGFVQRGAKRSIKDHLLTSYNKALVAIMKSQFTLKALQGGQRALLQFSEDIYTKELLRICEAESNSDLLETILHKPDAKKGTRRTITKLLHLVDNEDNDIDGDILIATGESLR